MVTGLLLEPGGALWVGTEGGGLNQFDATTGHFKAFRNNPLDPQSLSHDIVGEILTDRAGTLWVGTNRGLDRFDRRTERFTVFLHNGRDPASLSNEGITSIFEDRQGTLWIGTRGGLSRLERNQRLIRTFHHPGRSGE